MNTFFDLRLLRNALITLALSAVILFCAYIGPTVHLPFLAVVLSGLGVGFLEPKRGWFLALEIVAVVLMGSFLMQSYLPLTGAEAQRVQFVGYLTFFPALTGGLLGGFLKRAF